MYKLITKTLLLILFLGVLNIDTPVWAIEKNEFDEYITLQSISLNKRKDDVIEINLKVSKPFLTKPLIFEKNKNVYLISLIATNYDGNRNIDVSNLVDDISSVTVDFIPYKINTDQGYTRIIVNTKSKQHLVVNEQTGIFSKQVLQIIYIAAAVILVLIAIYLIFALYTRINKRKNKSQILQDCYDNAPNPDGSLTIEMDEDDIAGDNLALNDNEQVVQEISDDNSDMDAHTDISSSENDMQPSPEEIVDDILNNESVIDEISETIADDNIVLEENSQDEPDNNFSQEVVEESQELTDEHIEENFVREDNLDAVFTDTDNTDQPEPVVPNDEADFEDVDEDILDEISFDTIQDIDEHSAEILDEAFSGETKDSDDMSSEENVSVDVETEKPADDYTVNEIQVISGGDASIESKSFDLTADNIDSYSQDNSSGETQDTYDEISPFDALGFSGVMAGELNINENDIGENINALDNLEIDEQVAPIEQSIEEFDNTVDKIISQDNIADDQKSEEPVEEEIEYDIEENVEQAEIKTSAEVSPEEQVKKDSNDIVPENVSSANNITTGDNTLNELSIEENNVSDTELALTEDEISDFIVENAPKGEDLVHIPEESQTVQKEVVEVENISSDSNTQNSEDIDIEKYIVASNEEDDNELDIAAPVDINTETFFNDENKDNIPDNTDVFFVDNVSVDNDEKNKAFSENLNASKSSVQSEHEQLDDNEPIVLDKKYFSKNKPLYLIRHKGHYSLVAMIKDDVYVVEKFDKKPKKEEIILSHNEKRKDDDIYIVKVGSWRALLSVSKNEVKNILTL